MLSPVATDGAVDIDDDTFPSDDDPVVDADTTSTVDVTSTPVSTVADNPVVHTDVVDEINDK